MEEEQAVGTGVDRAPCPICGRQMEDGFLQFMSPYDSLNSLAQWIRVEPKPGGGLKESLPEDMGAVDWYSRTKELGGFRCRNCSLILLRY